MEIHLAAEFFTEGRQIPVGVLIINARVALNREERRWIGDWGLGRRVSR
jgi:hypothetical protein